ncbi:hypothetical protein P3T37_004317 [Kitasatospora sp. MAA4]|uniref:DUF4259 domain-containing protein n=1 Tax=Kitasatospora sp. MAA4 TaxID=3035093 RepID=UPI0024771CAA|nr:DUF4259 domain-containing protein [Kitasatospora sp. MAA4]MDH6134908.1 hypothetical protein [Kitasatospora sp. MAA4]
MGTWGAGLLDSDSAQDFLDQAKGMPTEARSALVEQVVVRVAGDASVVNREFVPEEVIAAVAIVAATITETGDYAWMHNEDLVEVTREMDPQIHLRDAAVLALAAVAGNRNSPLLSGWKSEDDLRSVEQQVDEIRSALSGS